jgi:nicotinic acid mononucleotide adenylyltransferase
LERVTVLVAPRPGTDSTLVAGTVPGAMFLDMAVLEVSGTGIRHLASTGQPFRFLVTEGVHRYVTENALYTEPQTGDMVEETRSRRSRL